MIKCPLPRYWMCHTLIALAIGVVLWPFIGLVAGLAAGAFFYVGREFTQWDQGDGPGLPIDWPGLLAPLLSCIALIAAIKVYAA